MNMDTSKIKPNTNNIKQLKKPIEIKFEQYECKDCKKKFYINTEDKSKVNLQCPFCKAETKNVRVFQIEIKGIGEY